MCLCLAKPIMAVCMVAALAFSITASFRPQWKLLEIDQNKTTAEQLKAFGSFLRQFGECFKSSSMYADCVGYENAIGIHRAAIVSLGIGATIAVIALLYMLAMGLLNCCLCCLLCFCDSLLWWPLQLLTLIGSFFTTFAAGCLWMTIGKSWPLSANSLYPFHPNVNSMAWCFAFTLTAAAFYNVALFLSACVMCSIRPKTLPKYSTVAN